MSNIQTQLLALYPINDQPISMATYLRHALHHLRSSGMGVSVQQECDLRNLRNLHNSKNATTSFRDMVVAVEGVMKDSLTDGAISALASANVFTLPTPIPMEPSKTGLYLSLFHGRRRLDESLPDWGSNGPSIGPMKYVHCTYGNEFKYEFEEGADFYGLEEDGYFSFVEDMVELDGAYYGDVTIYYHVSKEDMDRVTMLQDGLDRIERSVEALAQRLNQQAPDEGNPLESLG